MKLTNRLACIASKVPQGSKVADIGTDHAYIPIFLAKNYISKKIIASDIKRGPVEIAKKNILEHRVENFVEVRLGHGLRIIRPHEVDTIIIAGMGGLLIRDILDESIEVLGTIDTLILQPMIAHDVLREWLNRNGFMIVDEQLTKEGDKLYNIIVAKHGYECIDEIYFDIGKKLVENKDPLLNEFLDIKTNEMRKIIANLERETSESALLRRKQCKEKLSKYYDLSDELKE